MTYVEAINYLEWLHVFGIKEGLTRIKKLLNALDNPQTKYKTIHVTGTNGKGSVCAMLNEILSKAGFKVGLFTSPHLISYCERFRINGNKISEKNFADCVEKIAVIIDNIKVNGGDIPTQFEAMTAMAFDYFAREGVDYAVIEVGLGGTLDSTNVINPAVTAITNVGMDHADKCGGSLEGIAHHKAGIIKSGVPVVTAARGLPLEIIKRTAANLNAPIYVVNDNVIKDQEFFSSPTRPMFLAGTELDLQHLKLALEGEYQKENAAVAIAAAQLLDEPKITLSTIKNALESVKWAGRFERFTVDNQTVIIDGAHNPDGARALRQSLDITFGDRPRKYLFGVLGDKDFRSMIDILFRQSDEVIVTRPNSDRAADPKIIVDILNGKTIRAESVDNIKDAFNAWLNGREENSIAVAAGSLYMIGEVRDLLNRKIL